MAKLETLIDNFSSFDAGKWTKAGYNTAQITYPSNTLRIDHDAASSAGNYNRVVSATTYDLTASYGYVEVPDAGNQTINQHEVQFIIRLDANNMLFFVLDGNLLYAYKMVASTVTSLGSISYNSTTHRWWRYRESGGTTYWDTSPDGTSWTQRFFLANPFALTALSVTLQTGNWAAASGANYAVFDSFNGGAAPTPTTGIIANATGSAEPTGSTTVVVTKPTGTTSGDVMVAYQAGVWGLHDAMTAPVDWTLLGGEDMGTNDYHKKIWVKTAASEGANYTFGKAADDAVIVTIVTLRGVDTNISNWGVDVTSTTTGARVCNSLSGVPTNAILLCSASAQGDNVVGDIAFTPPSGMTEQTDEQPSTFTALTVASLLNPANPTGTKTFAMTGTTYDDHGIQSTVVIPPVGSAVTSSTGLGFRMFNLTRGA